MSITIKKNYFLTPWKWGYSLTVDQGLSIVMFTFIMALLFYQTFQITELTKALQSLSIHQQVLELELMQKNLIIDNLQNSIGLVSSAGELKNSPIPNIGEIESKNKLTKFFIKAVVVCAVTVLAVVAVNYGLSVFGSGGAASGGASGGATSGGASGGAASQDSATEGAERIINFFQTDLTNHINWYVRVTDGEKMSMELFGKFEHWEDYHGCADFMEYTLATANVGKLASITEAIEPLFTGI